MSSPLVAAIEDTHPWLDRFTRREYAKAFRCYVDLHGDACLALIRSATDPMVLAVETLDELEAERKKLRFWNRGGIIFDQKQTVIKYFAPMLLQLGCGEFAEALRAAWNKRWPKDPYDHATFEQLSSSFVNVILGITMPNKD